MLLPSRRDPRMVGRRSYILCPLVCPSLGRQVRCIETRGDQMGRMSCMSAKVIISIEIDSWGSLVKVFTSLWIQSSSWPSTIDMRLHKMSLNPALGELWAHSINLVLLVLVHPETSIDSPDTTSSIPICRLGCVGWDERNDLRVKVI